MSNVIQIPGLRGTIYKRGKNSFRIQLSLGRNAQGKYDVKRETIRGTQQDAIDLLTRWNVEYMDNTIANTTHETVQQAYETWIAEMKGYRKPNTYHFYKEKWESYIMSEIGHKRLKDVTLSDLQKILLKYPSLDRQIKNALSPFYTWCVDNKKLKENICFKLKLRSKDLHKTEEDVWTLEEVQKVYSALTFENLYDIFIVLGVECGMRPQEILGLAWDKINDNYIAIEQAVIERTPDRFKLGSTKTGKARYFPLTPFLHDKLMLHKANQLLRINTTKGYNDNNLVVADAMGHVAYLNYIRKYFRQVAKKAGVKYIPPKNLRATHISLATDFNLPLPSIQQAVGHEPGSPVTGRHYISLYTDSLQHYATAFHRKLHEAMQ